MSEKIESLKGKDIIVINLFGDGTEEVLENEIYGNIHGDVIVISSFEDIISYISSEGGVNGAVISSLSFESILPSALAASFHQMPVFFPQVESPDCINSSEKIWGYVSDAKCGYEPVNDFQYLMNNTSDLAGYINNTKIPFGSKILIVSPRDEIKMTVDRALSGTFIVGRFPGSQNLAVSLINRGRFYDDLRYANPNPDKLLASFVAYNHGIRYNDRVIWESEDVRGSFEQTYFDVEFKTSKDGILDSLQNGTALWYHANHGEVDGVIFDADGRIGVFDKDVWRAYEKRGSVENPDTMNKFGGFRQDGLVMPFEETSIYGSDLDKLDNLHSQINIFMDCTIASTNIPNVLLEHGSVNVVSSFTTIHFSAGGYFTTGVNERLCNGASIGDAFTNTLNQSAPIYYDGSGYANGTSLNFVLFGDPDVVLIKHFQQSDN